MPDEGVVEVVQTSIGEGEEEAYKELVGPSTRSSDARNLGGAQNNRQNMGGGHFSEVQAPQAIRI
jgi:hypothetical protein